MIKLDVEEYCHSCPDFEADVETPVTYCSVDDMFTIGDTIIRCSFRHRCKHIKEYVTKNKEEKE